MSPRRLELAHCIACGHTSADLLADEDAMRREVEALWEFQGRRLDPAAPLDQLADRVVFSQDPPFRLVRCAQCGLVYRSPWERPGDVVEMYASDALDGKVLSELRAAEMERSRARARRLRRLIGRGGNVLEVGSYTGAFLAAARESGLNAEGVDLNARTNERVRALGLAIHDGDLLSFEAKTTYDAIVIWNTFDQLGDPRAVLHRARAILNPRGLLALRFPNGDFYARFRRRPSRRLGAVATYVLAHNNMLGFPYRFGFTPRAIAKLLDSSGFESLHVRGDTLSGRSDSWTRPWALIERTLAGSAFRASAALRLDWAPWLECWVRGLLPRT